MWQNGLFDNQCFNFSRTSKFSIKKTHLRLMRQNPEYSHIGFILIPLSPGLEDTELLREKYFNIVLDRLELITEQEIKKNIIYKKSFCVSDFIKEYNSYKGNAYGLANTLMQTSFLRPKLKSKLVKNLYFTGQLTVPGPGVPPAIVSGKLVAELIIKQLK